jgi:hypothetical protein
MPCGGDSHNLPYLSEASEHGPPPTTREDASYADPMQLPTSAEPSTDGMVRIHQSTDQAIRAPMAAATAA